MNREYTNLPPQNLAFAPIGLPIPTSGTAGSSPINSVNSSVPGTPGCVNPTNNNAQPPYLNHLQRPSSIIRHSSRSEEESDHEYYNTHDRLKREMQPLQQLPRKSETTV